jgi:hypothetical protein
MENYGLESRAGSFHDQQPRGRPIEQAEEERQMRRKGSAAIFYRDRCLRGYSQIIIAPLPVLLVASSHTFFLKIASYNSEFYAMDEDAGHAGKKPNQ